VEASLPRQPRYDAPGLTHHIWSRGIDGRAIFHDDRDRWDLLGRLNRVLPESGVRCFVFALMSNHVHFVVQTGPVPLAAVLKRVNTGFAVRFNRLRKRSGYLFQGRFGSRPIHDDVELRVAIAYVLRNPLKAGLVRTLDELGRYPWSTYGALVGRRSPLAFESIGATLRAFGEADPATAIADAVMGGLSAPKPTLAELIRQVCDEEGVPERELRSGRMSGGAIRARGALYRTAIVEHGFRATDVARALGISRSAVSQALRRTRQARLNKKDRPLA
jgi:REP element-mobilizing transposase RayT